MSRVRPDNCTGRPFSYLWTLARVQIQRTAPSALRIRNSDSKSVPVLTASCNARSTSSRSSGSTWVRYVSYVSSRAAAGYPKIALCCGERQTLRLTRSRSQAPSFAALSMNSKRASFSRSARRASRKLTIISPIGTTVITNSPSPQADAGSAMAKECVGAIKSHVAVSALSAIATRLGPRPPTQAATITATVKDQYGTCRPKTRWDASLRPAAATTASTATLYLQMMLASDTWRACRTILSERLRWPALDFWGVDADFGLSHGTQKRIELPSIQPDERRVTLMQITAASNLEPLCSLRQR